MKRTDHPLGVPQGPDGVLDTERGVASTGSPNAVDRWAVRRVAQAMGEPPIAFDLWDGSTGYEPDGQRVGRVRFNDRRALWSVIMSPELGFGDCYSTGRIDIEGDLVEVLYRGFSAIDRRSPVRFKRSLLGRLPQASTNTHEGSRRHIQHHYDLGNDFYRLWLDERMVYTCAYYPSPDATLEEAQVAKMHHVCRKAGLAPGMQVVEAGCGWGSLALHMAEHYGVNVRAFNISTEQIAYARERARERNLDHLVEFVKDDYRNIEGTYDAFVSVGMLEHVGVDHYTELGDLVRRVLGPGGRGVIHSVGRSRPSPVNAWLEKRIFPGSYPPSLREMMAIFEPSGFSVLDVENLRLHYAKTLMEWLARFDSQAETVRRMYDDYFVRAWRLYLAGCAAAFMASSIQLYQVVFTHPRHNRIPLTRDYLYREGNDAVWDLG